LGQDEHHVFRLEKTTCSACENFIIKLRRNVPGGNAATVRREMIWPRGASRPVPPEVPEPYAGDFCEACIVLPDSANASAAISRRCLQSLLVDAGGAKAGRLFTQIEEVVESKQLRPGLADNLHYVRQVGNLAAHENKNANTGEVLDATAEEAEWLVEVLEGLFEHYFVEPAREKTRREEFDARIEAAKQKSASAS
jgi:hypothetical protein